MNIKARLPFISYITHLNPSTSIILNNTSIMDIFITFIPIYKNDKVDYDYYSIEWRNYKYSESGIIENIKTGSPMNKRINTWMSWRSASRINTEYI